LVIEIAAFGLPLPAAGAFAVAALTRALDLGRGPLEAGPTSSASSSVTDRLSPSGVSQLRWRSRSVTITRLLTRAVTAAQTGAGIILKEVAGGMDVHVAAGTGVRFISEAGVQQHPVEDLTALLARDDGLVWVDIPVCDEAAAKVLSETFGFHPLAIRACIERNAVPKVRAYRDHSFVILHAPELGTGGHVHYVELDQFIGPRYLVTVHGPVNPAVPPEAALRETRAVLGRIEAGRLRPRSAFELSYAIVSALALGQEGFVETVTRQVWPLEQRVTSGHLGDPEQFLEELFGTRHALLAVSNMATLGHQIYQRMSALGRFIPPDCQPLVADLEDQFARVAGVADGQIRYLEGVIEFYKARTDTKVTIAAERLALIAVLTLPITALSSVYGMNIIVNDRTDFPHLAVVLAAMIAISIVLLRWAKQQGWW
jgi:Mg2+ and Co2+ transporter CorA